MIGRYIKTYHPKGNAVPSTALLNRYLNSGWIAQPKYNGVRNQVHVASASDIVVYTRYGNKFLGDHLYCNSALGHSLHSCLANCAVEGEFIAGNLYVFDILIHNGIACNAMRYFDRYRLLADTIIETNNLQLVKNITELPTPSALIEGIVLKKNDIGFGNNSIIRARFKK